MAIGVAFTFLQLLKQSVVDKNFYYFAKKR